MSRIFLSLTFASREELGWDRTITPVPMGASDGIRQYVITVDGVEYHTVEVLSDYSADTIVGRATRVWKVKDASGTEFVLKDVWAETDRKLEHELREEILRAIPEENREKVADHLLTPLKHWLVEASDQVDHTTNVAMRKQGPSFRRFFALVFKKIPATEKMPSGLGPSAASDREARSERIEQPKSRNYGPGDRQVLHERQHYRIVFKEVATPLFSVSFLSQVFTVLADVAEGMIRLWFSVTALDFG